MTLKWMVTVPAFVLSGCASYQNLTAEDIRSDKHYYKAFVVNKSMSDIETTLFDYRRKCGPNVTMEVHPSNRKTGIVQIAIPGFTSTSVIVVMDFAETGEHETTIKSYTYYPAWEKHINKVVDATKGGPCI